jgi:hypothetical protein
MGFDGLEQGSPWLVNVAVRNLSVVASFILPWATPDDPPQMKAANLHLASAFLVP